MSAFDHHPVCQYQLISGHPRELDGNSGGNSTENVSLLEWPFPSNWRLWDGRRNASSDAGQEKRNDDGYVLLRGAAIEL
jgi:hypothetical protein